MAATVQLIIKTDHVGHEEDIWLFRTNKARYEICSLDGDPTEDFLEFLKNNYNEEIYKWIEDEYEYEILYIYDEHADIIDF